MILPNKSDETALARHAAVCWIQEALKENFTLTRALALASQRPWGGTLYGPSTLEGWYYAFKHQGFSALQRQPRKDKGTRKALSRKPRKRCCNCAVNTPNSRFDSWCGS